MTSDWLEQLKKKAEAGKAHAAGISAAPSAPEASTSAETAAGAAENQEAVVPIHAETPEKKAPRPMESHDRWDYREMYRTAYKFHERHHLTEVPPEGWYAYWSRIAKDSVIVAEPFEGNVFFSNLLDAVLLELESESIALKKAQQDRELYQQGT